MRRTRLHNTATGKWELWTITESPLISWRWIRLQFLLTRRALHWPHVIRRKYPQEYVFDEDELCMKRPERKWHGVFLKISKAIVSMIEMQKLLN